MSKPIAILHIHGRMGRGGAEMRTVELLRNIDRRRYRFDFCALSGLNGELDAEIRDLDGEVHPLRAGRRDFARRFEHLLRRGRYDVVHSHLHYHSGYLLRLAARCGVPVRVAHFRNARAQRCGTPMRRLARSLLSPVVERFAGDRVMRRWMDRYATDILGVSRAALDSAWGPRWRSDPRCRVVYDGLESAPLAAARDVAGVRREFGLAEDGPLCIHVGRMTQQKNHLRLVSIFREVCRREPAARLLIVSRTAVSRNEKALERSVRRRIDELALGDRVVFSGERTDVPRLIKAADVLIFPSIIEGLGDVVLESCACGTPVLGSDVPSIREIAGRLGGVRCLPLSESDAKWGELAVAMAAEAPSAEQRRAALEAFILSEFTVEKCMESLCRIWRGGAADA